MRQIRTAQPYDVLTSSQNKSPVHTQFSIGRLFFLFFLGYINFFKHIYDILIRRGLNIHRTTVLNQTFTESDIIVQRFLAHNIYYMVIVIFFNYSAFTVLLLFCAILTIKYVPEIGRGNLVRNTNLVKHK